MLMVFESRSGRRERCYLLPADCDTLRKPSPYLVSERGQGPLKTTESDLCIVLLVRERAHKIEH